MFGNPSAHGSMASGRLSRAVEILSILLIACAVPTYALQQEINAAATKLADRLTKAGKKSIAVVDFTDLQGNVTELGRFLAEQLSVALEGTAQSFSVIDRTHLKAILQEHKLSASGLIDPQTVRKLGQIAGVETLAIGNITPLGDSVNLSIKAIDTETARLVGAVNVEIPRTKAIDELLGRGLTGVQTASTPSTPQPGGGGTDTPSAPPKKTVSATSGDVQLSAQSCRRGGAKVACRVTVTNTGSESFRFQIVPERSYFVDDQGNQTTFWAQGPEAAFGNGTGESDLEPGLPTNLVLARMEVPTEVRSVSLVIAFYHLTKGHFRVIGSYGGGDLYVVTLRGVSIE